jgi:AcrR family transcriptional regulator
MERDGPEDRPEAGARRSRKRARTRSEIFQAGLRLLASEGLEEVTVARICAAADVARATFFLHFPSKRALLIELNDRLALELRDRLAARPGRAASEYRTAVDLLVERWPRQPDVLAGLLDELLREPGPLAPGENGGQDLPDVVAGIVRRGQDRGELRRNVPARLAATAFLAVTAAVLAGAARGEGRSTPEEIRNPLLHLVLHGMLEPKPRLKWRRPDLDGNASEKP